MLFAATVAILALAAHLPATVVAQERGAPDTETARHEPLRTTSQGEPTHGAATDEARPSGRDNHLHVMGGRLAEDAVQIAGLAPEDDGPAACVDGFAGPYPCERVDLAAHLPLSAIGGGSGTDVWGWTDPLTGSEYALMGRSNGTAFVDVTDPENPVYLGNLPTHTFATSWRDIKVHQNHAYVVADLAGGHGLQVFDLTELRAVANPPVTFSETAHYAGFGSAHNVVINEQSGFAYAVGGDCSGGLHMIDLQDPLAPQFAGCFADDGYTHDAQCVDYAGPDPDHAGREICFNSNEDTLTIVDVTDKSAPAQLSRTTYAGSGYAHQGWLTDDHAYFLLDDELDESSFGHNTRTRIWDVRDLDAPLVIGAYDGPLPSIDHNQYVHDGYLYQANYTSGLRILDLDDVAAGSLVEVAHFDIHPATDAPGFSGAWSVYPYFASGTVVVSGIGEGLFVLQPRLCADPQPPGGLVATPAGDNAIHLDWSAGGEPGVTFDVYRSFGGCPGGAFERIATGVAATDYTDATVSGLVEYAYVVTAVDESGFCESAPSNCASASTTGECNAPPVFGGLTAVDNPAAADCALDLAWDAATPNCGAGVTYAVYRDLSPGFVPAAANRIASGVAGTGYSDGTVQPFQPYWYVVRATDTGNGVEDGNLTERSGVATGPATDGPWSAGAEVGDPTLLYFSSATAGDLERHLGWELSEARQHSGARSYHSGYANGICVAVATPPLELTAGESPALDFWTAYDVEFEWDGGVVELSTDGGASWSLLPLVPDYPDAFRASADACGYLEGHPAFTGTDLTWQQHAADLAAFSGQTVQVRWIFSTDGSVTAEGWYIDDVTVTHVQVPGQCVPGGGIFSDGFESGDFSAWSGTGG